MKKECRICLDTKGKMISPCRCDGSSKWIHPSCLEKTKQVTGHIVCETCKSLYEDVMIYVFLPNILDSFIYEHSILALFLSLLAIFVSLMGLIMITQLLIHDEFNNVVCLLPFIGADQCYCLLLLHTRI